MLAWRSEGTHWHREKYDSRTHGRDEHCTRIFDATCGLVTRICDRVRHLILLSLKLQLISPIPTVP